MHGASQRLFLGLLRETIFCTFFTPPEDYLLQTTLRVGGRVDVNGPSLGGPARLWISGPTIRTSVRLTLWPVQTHLTY